MMIEAGRGRDPVAMRTVLASHLGNKLDVVIEQLRSAKQTASSTAQA